MLEVFYVSVALILSAAGQPHIVAMDHPFITHKECMESSAKAKTVVEGAGGKVLLAECVILGKKA
jgi:hypothetical protein